MPMSSIELFMYSFTVNKHLLYLRPHVLYLSAPVRTILCHAHVSIYFVYAHAYLTSEYLLHILPVMEGEKCSHVAAFNWL